MKRLFIILLLYFSCATIVSAQTQLRPTRSQSETLNEIYCTGFFNTADGTYFDMQEYFNRNSAIVYLNILDLLQGRVAGLRISSRGYFLRVPFIRQQPAAVFIDEMWVSYDYLSMLPVADIAMIKVIRGPFIGGRSSAGGAIAIYTIRGDGAEEEE